MDDILDTEQASELLKISTKTLWKLSDKGEIPARRVGREWRFSRQALIDWVAGGKSSGKDKA